MNAVSSRRAEWTTRLAVAGRVVLAAGGGYGLAALSTALLSLVLPLSRAEAVTSATLLSFALMVGAAVYVFAARSLGRAAISMAVLAGILGGTLWLVMKMIQTGSPA
ncbi:MAG: iron transporter [Methylobacterium sp.]|uniref:iron transporter n=1 Tax=Methylobacterium sp. TaxID=409 RepID=UPI0025D0DF2D|nr:iron transporter [Methylobacterium sp.]MBX9930822.1 iron transporter [Methylobacterium sp.]